MECISAGKSYPERIELKKSSAVQPIRKDRLMGMSYTQIARKYSIDPRTAKRYAENNLPTECLQQRPFCSVLDPYKECINEWLLEEPLKTTVIFNRLKERGCNCGYTIVNDYVRKVKQRLSTVSEG